MTELFLGKKGSSEGDSGHWHVFRSKDSEISICGNVSRSSLSPRLDLRVFERGKQDLEDVKGLGGVCTSCREYITGSLSDKELPKPGNGSDKYGTSINILEDYRKDVRGVKR